MREVIKIVDISKKFKNNQVLSHVDLSCEAGKIYGIVGYNGCGKTVLFKCICGFYKVDYGDIYIRGKKMHHEIDMIQNAGIIIEHPAFLPGFTGIQILEMLYGINHKRNKVHLEEVLEQVGLNPKLKTSVEKYSLGMQQRLAIAQAIMEEQDILILDEPMNGLDKSGVKEMRSLFLELKEKGKVIIMASHNKEDIEILCDHVYEMDRGMLTKIK